MANPGANGHPENPPGPTIAPDSTTISAFLARHGIEGGISLEGERLSRRNSSAKANPREPDSPNPAESAAPSSILTDGKGGRYDVGEEVARGGMGAILEARDVNCRRTVAMKVMLKGKKAKRESVARFIEEAQVTSQLEHPNVVPVARVQAKPMWILHELTRQD